MNETIPELEREIQWQLDLAFTGEFDPVDPLEFAEKFKGNPNEAYHILDCQTLRTYFLEDRFAEVFRMPEFHPKTAFEVLEQIHPSHMKKVMDFMAAVLTNEVLHTVGENSVVQVFMNQNEEMILKTSTPLEMDSNHHVIWVLEQHTNVSNLVPKGIYKWTIKGPKAETITKSINEILKPSTLLSPQELNVLRALDGGLTSKLAGERLFISKHTVDTHRRNILKKLGVKNTVVAIQKAKDSGLLF